MNTIRESHERTDYTDLNVFSGICRDALAVAYGHQYYADELHELSADLITHFAHPVMV